ncbi:MAG: hypothetical protein LW808_000840 [Verrucomicrobiota bacterium]|nr:MAG: hypothetical protein LW808_000840 [Verrucomicrobiota bacterium]
MNYPAIVRTLAYIALVLSVSFAICAGCDVYFFGNINGKDWLPAIEITAIVFVIFFIFSIHRKPELFRRESIAIVGLSWLFACALGMLPYLFVAKLSFCDAFWEATSGITTTGMTVFSHPETIGRGILLWRALSTAIGGLGFAVFFIVFTPSVGTTAKQIFAQESSYDVADFDAGKMQSNVRPLLYVYLTLTLACFALFLIFGMSFYDALCYALSTVATGGFSTHTEGFQAFQSPFLPWIAAFFMILGGLNFFCFIALARHRYDKIRENSEIKIYCLLVLLSGLFVYVAQRVNGSPLSLQEGYFHAISTLSTCGATLSDTAIIWTPVNQMLLILLMSFGGCVGSTAGGLKVARIGIFFKALTHTLLCSFRPQRVQNIYFNHRRIDNNDLSSTLRFCIFAFFFTILSALVLLVLEPKLDFANGIATAVALVSNSGVIATSSPPDFRLFSDLTKIVAALMMILGRIEFYALIVLLAPQFWKKY